MQDEACRSDDAVATFLLRAGQPREKFVGYVLAQANLAEALARDGKPLLALERTDGVLGTRRVVRKLEGRHLRIVDFAKVVIEPRHLEPVGVRRHHAPRDEIVERRTPEYGLLTACIHRHVAADARCVGRGWIDCKYQTGSL